MIIIAYILAIFIGISLGLIGSGGSILTIPILVYLLGIEPQNATVYSLFIVGIVSLLGSIKCFQEKLVDIKTVFLFGIPSIVAILLMRNIINPIIPQTIIEVKGFIITKNVLIMLVFASLMITASIAMIKPQKHHATIIKKSNFHLITQGIVVGLVTGFVGVGGGFLIIPTLLFYARLPMNKAVATSLVIISANALIGFASSVLNVSSINWTILFSFTAFATGGIFIGRYLSKFLSNEKLKPAFGWFILLTGIYILVKEIFLTH